MRDNGEPGPARLVLPPEGFARQERLVAYEIGNTLLRLHLELQQRFGLRAEEYQIFLLIVMSTVQRLARAPGDNEALFDRTPLPPEESGSISRRRISETLDIPLETVCRAVAGLRTVWSSSAAADVCQHQAARLHCSAKTQSPKAWRAVS